MITNMTQTDVIEFFNTIEYLGGGRTELPTRPHVSW